MTSIRQDIVYGFRTLLKRPGFTVIATLSLALGIAANTTIFSIINATLLSPLAFEDSDRLVAITTYPLEFPENRGVAGYREWDAWRDARSFESVGGMVPGRNVRNLGAEQDGAPAEELEAIRANTAMFRTLGIRPQLGRVFTEEEDQVDNTAPVVLITDRFWERRFERDPAVLGRTLRLDGVVTTIIGVLPPGIEEALFRPNASLWVPWGVVAAQTISDARFITVFARLAPGTGIDAARAELDGIATRFRQEYPNSNETTGFNAMGLHEFFYSGLDEPLFVLQGAVLFVLLIACANVAGLLLAHASSRQMEVAIRSAVGAARTRLVRQVLTESVVLSAIGGLLGVFLAWGGIRVFVRAAPPGLPGMDQMSINLNVLAFTALVVVATAVVFGIVPAVQGSRPDLTSLLNDSSRGSSGGIARQRLRLVMVAFQTGVALMLLISAGLLINSFIRLQDNDLGADPEGILTFRLQFSQEETITFTGEQVRGVGLWDVNPGVETTIRQVYDELRSIPGLVSVAGVNVPPFQGAMGMNFKIAGRPEETGDAQTGAAYLAVTPGYFSTLRVQPSRGRVFTDRDNEIAPPVVVINDAMARQFWPDEDPVGTYLAFDYVPGEQPRQVIGVVPNILLSQFQEAATPTMYVPHRQQTDTWLGPNWGLRAMMYFMVRGTGDPMRLLPTVQQAVARVDPNRPLTEVRTIDQYLGEQMQGNVLWVSLLGVFGGIAGVLAVIGIYGVVSYAVAQRTHEIGIRVALGASGAAIMKLVMRQAAVVVGIGLVFGIGGSLLTTRLIEGTLWGVEPTDPLTFSAVTLLLLVVALVACTVPTRRAMAVDPSEALRYE